MGFLSSLGDFLGGAGGLLGGLTSAGQALFGPSSGQQVQMQLEAQKELYQFQNEINVDNYKHRHQWETEDLKAAGLNPILSANSGASVASASGALGNSVSSAEQAKAQKIQNMIAGFQALSASAEKMANAKLLSETAQNQAYVRDNMQIENIYKWASLPLIASQMRVNDAQALNYVASAGYSNSARDVNLVEQALRKGEFLNLSAYGRRERSYGSIGNMISDAAFDILRPFSNFKNQRFGIKLDDY